MNPDHWPDGILVMPFMGKTNKPRTLQPNSNTAMSSETSQQSETNLIQQPLNGQGSQVTSPKHTSTESQYHQEPPPEPETNSVRDILPNLPSPINDTGSCNDWAANVNHELTSKCVAG